MMMKQVSYPEPAPVGQALPRVRGYEAPSDCVADGKVLGAADWTSGFVCDEIAALQEKISKGIIPNSTASSSPLSRGFDVRLHQAKQTPGVSEACVQANAARKDNR